MVRAYVRLTNHRGDRVSVFEGERVFYSSKEYVIEKIGKKYVELSPVIRSVEVPRDRLASIWTTKEK